jgi:hypothetical protein
MDDQRSSRQAGNGKTPQRLNVIIHGLWGIETNDDGIRLTTPPVEHHVIAAGKIANPEIDLMASKERTYNLTGVQQGSRLDFNRERVFSVDKIHFADRYKIEVEVLLPYPKEIHSVREFQTGQPFFAGDVKTPPETGTVVQVLVYEATAPGAPRLSPSAWAPGEDEIVNLHLYAQPERQPADPHHHVREGFAKLAAAYGIQVEVLKEVKASLALDPGIPGLKAADVMALFELNGPVVSPPTCDMFIFDNT